MYFRNEAAYAKAVAASRPPSIALVTGGRSGIGLAIAKKLASFAFIDTVLAVSRSISDADVSNMSSTKIQALQADVGTPEGRQIIVDRVAKLCRGVKKDDSKNNTRQKQLSFLIHSAGTIDPIKNILQVTPEELRHAMNINVEAPFFLTMALYPYMTPLEEDAAAAAGGDDDDDQNKNMSGRVLHVSSGAAHGAPPAGWGCYGITKAAFFQSYRVLEREFRETLGGKVVVGSFKPGVVDTSMQGTIRESSFDDMPIVEIFKRMKEKAGSDNTVNITNEARPPPSGALDSPDNVACFVEYLLLGTTDEEFANKDSPSEYDIRNKDLFPKWIAAENLP